MLSTKVCLLLLQYSSVDVLCIARGVHTHTHTCIQVFKYEKKMLRARPNYFAEVDYKRIARKHFGTTR